MKDLLIVLSYDGAEKMVPTWAQEEESINFRREHERATRNTVSFAATELKEHLLQCLEGVNIQYGSKVDSARLCLELKVEDPASKAGEFSLEPIDQGLRIIGCGRAGLLYGVYEFLRMQGWRWYAPGKEGIIAPNISSELKFPEKKTHFTPSMPEGRGFDLQFLSKESAELWVWMARNRLNVGPYRPLTALLANKLGMTFKNGGHVFEKMLDPDRIMPSGKILWDEHRNWYGLPPDGIHSKELALKIQFCVSQDDLVDFLCEGLLGYLMGKWKTADRVDIWGFDTWGSTCGCEACRSIGNSTDQNLYFMSKLRSYLNEARREDRLDHDVQLIMCGYEGTCTIQGPEKPVPDNLIQAKDLMVYYPIRRCYAHDFSEKNCEINLFYHDALESWFNNQPTPPVIIGEYYNVSKFEDLPILFTERITQDIPHYHAMGVRGATYMHLPMVNWGMRTLTQLLYAQMLWDIETDVETFLEDYFENWYGPYASEMRRVYELAEQAWAYSADWRAWGPRSVLSQILDWDGQKPEEPLQLDNHFVNTDGAVENGRRAIVMMEQAMVVVNTVRLKNREEAARHKSLASDLTVNPVEVRALEKFDRYTKRIAEDRRSLIYGLDTMKVMTELTAYHEALRVRDVNETISTWEKIEELEDALDSYYVPIDYEYPTPGLESKDALTRTQTRDVIVRCRKYRQSQLT